MTKYGVEFTIEAPNLGTATNRALVALYKGDLDAEDVRVFPKDGGDKYRTYGEEGEKEVTIRTPAPNPARTGGLLSEFTLIDPPSQKDIDAVKKKIQDGRKKIPKEPHKEQFFAVDTTDTGENNKIVKETDVD